MLMVQVHESGIEVEYKARFSFLSPQVTTLCPGKEGEPAPGDLDAEAHQLADEAKKDLPRVTRHQASPALHPQTPSIALRTFSQ